MKKLISLFLLFAFPFIAGLLEAGDAPSFKIVVNASNSTSSLSRAEISNLFLKKTTVWSNGNKVLPIDQAEGAAVREAFSEQIHGKNVSAIKGYWQKQIFSGRGVPPPEKESDKEIIAYVQENPGAIGYISGATPIGDGIRVLKAE